MKWIVYLVLLANIVWFAWHYRQPTSHDAVAAERAAGMAELVLLEEAGSRPGDRSGEDAAPPSRAGCYTIGPFEAQAMALRAQERLHEVGVTARLRVDESIERTGYWVLLPPFPSRSAALQAVARLKRASVSDYFLVAAGRHKDAVSLGVFSSEPRAERRLREMRRLGFEPKLEAVQLPDRKHWLDVDADGSERLDQSHLEALRPIYPDVARQEADCARE